VAFQLHDTEQVTLVVEALDAEGNEAAATTTWESSTRRSPRFAIPAADRPL
jgi:hypothetical protein